MRAQGRHTALLALVATVALSSVVIALHDPPRQAPSLAVFVDGATEVMRTADRIALSATRIPIDEEVAIGNALARTMTPGGLAPTRAESNPEAAAELYLQRIVDSLTQTTRLRREGIPYRVRLLPWVVVNAFALPGGHLYVTQGMLDFVESEAELAAVIGHEIAHVDLKHCIERVQYAHRAKKLGGDILATITQLSYRFFSVGYSDELESEADRHGLLLAEAAGYHPQGAQLLFSRLGRRYGGGVKDDKPTVEKEISDMIRGGFADIFQSHPDTRERVQNLGVLIDEQGYDVAGRYYLGKANLKRRQARIDLELAEEFVQAAIYPPLGESPAE